MSDEAGIESRFVSGVGTVISYAGTGRVRLRDMWLDLEMTADIARRLAAVLNTAANEASLT